MTYRKQCDWTVCVKVLEVHQSDKTTIEQYAHLSQGQDRTTCFFQDTKGKIFSLRSHILIDPKQSPSIILLEKQVQLLQGIFTQVSTTSQLSKLWFFPLMLKSYKQTHTQIILITTKRACNSLCSH